MKEISSLSMKFYLYLKTIMRLSQVLPVSPFPFRDSHGFSKRSFKENFLSVQCEPPSIQQFQQTLYPGDFVSVIYPRP